MTAAHDWGRKALHPPHFFKRRRRTHEWLRQFSVPVLEAMARHETITMTQIAADCSAELNTVRTLLGLGIQGSGADLWLFGHGNDRYVQAVIENVDIMLEYMTAVEELEIRRRMHMTRKQLFAKWRKLPKAEEHDEDAKARFPIRLERDELLDGLGLDEMVAEVRKMGRKGRPSRPVKRSGQPQPHSEGESR